MFTRTLSWAIAWNALQPCSSKPIKHEEIGTIVCFGSSHALEARGEILGLSRWNFLPNLSQET
jgi:hypothetical protein